MKKFTSIYNFGLLSILFVLGAFCYFALIILEYPLVGIEVKEKDNQWIVEKTYEKGWVGNQAIDEGDIIKLVDGKTPEQHLSILLFDRVEKAHSITISDENLIENTFFISYSDLSSQYVIYLILPFFFATITLALSFYLYRRKKTEKSAIILIYFLLSIGVTYLSASVSARGDIIGTIINTLTLPGSLILFAHFIRSYLLQFQLKFIKSKSLLIIYVLYSIVLILVISNLIFYQLNNDFIVKLELFFILLLVAYLFFHLIVFYLKHRHAEGNNVLKILWMTLLAAFSPFVCLYVMPIIIFSEAFVPAEFTAIFLIIIPIAFVYLQLAERLFDIEFLLGKLRYYSLLAFPFTAFTILIISIITQMKLLSRVTVFLFLLIFTFVVLFLYIKEFVDYKMRGHFFSPKNNFEKSLYTFFKKATYETKVESLIASIVQEIQDVLRVKKVLYIEVVTKVNEKNWFLKNQNQYSRSFIKSIESTLWDNYHIGSLFEVKGDFGIIIGGDYSTKHIILFGMKNSNTNLNIQEKIWLETLAYFSSILLENFQLIENLVEEIEKYKGEQEGDKTNYPHWFSRLLFKLSEKERANLSIDLHDSVLQEQLQLLREVDKLKKADLDVAIKNDISNLKERVLDSIHLIRETCNELRPPFLTEIGIIPSIQNLVNQTKLRCHFILTTELDESIRYLDRECELALYRVIQELLSNAMKHSLASEVKISLRENNQTLYLQYWDNGIGIDMVNVTQSFKTMGIIGMRERINSIGGTMKMDSAVGQGTQVFVEINIGRNVV
ncbi:sensor histidine kinase [Gracilibacillus marinus]|uniref:Sensor histidine kinase n=1 Tax=Gracilibacillus marinus TaxID=630535 RepID=A0ABV8VV46_9BACI